MSQQRILTSELAQHVGHRVVLQGWLHKLRQLGAVNFLVLRDRAGIAQAVLGPDELAALQSIAVESIVAVEGKVIAAAAAPGGYELHDVVIQIINPVTEAPPVAINKKRVNAALPTILSSAVVSYRHPYHRAIFRLGGGVMHGFRRKLHELAFTEIQTPKLVGSATESGANVYSVDHFGQTAYLAQSPQFYKQIMVGVFERVYEVGPVFRAEKHATSRHINEYVSLDAEFGFIEDHFSVMEMVTIVIEAILSHLATCHADDLALLEADMPQAIHSQDGRYFPWIHFQDARALLAEEFGATDTAGAVDLTPEHERLLGQWALNAHGSDFLFVVGYPMRKRPFYTHPDPRDPVHSNSFDLLFRGTELITGGQRLHRYEDYLQALEQRGYSPTDFTHYLDAFRYGMPPHGGFAIGLERFVMQLLGLENIRLATLFPRDINRLTP